MKTESVTILLLSAVLSTGSILSSVAAPPVAAPSVAAPSVAALPDDDLITEASGFRGGPGAATAELESRALDNADPNSFGKKEDDPPPPPPVATDAFHFDASPVPAKFRLGVDAGFQKRFDEIGEKLVLVVVEEGSNIVSRQDALVKEMREKDKILEIDLQKALNEKRESFTRADKNWTNAKSELEFRSNEWSRLFAREQEIIDRQTQLSATNAIRSEVEAKWIADLEAASNKVSRAQWNFIQATNDVHSAETNLQSVAKKLKQARSDANDASNRWAAAAADAKKLGEAGKKWNEAVAVKSKAAGTLERARRDWKAATNAVSRAEATRGRSALWRFLHFVPDEDGAIRRRDEAATKLAAAENDLETANTGVTTAFSDFWKAAGGLKGDASVSDAVSAAERNRIEREAEKTKKEREVGRLAELLTKAEGLLANDQGKVPGLRQELEEKNEALGNVERRKVEALDLMGEDQLGAELTNAMAKVREVYWEDPSSGAKGGALVDAETNLTAWANARAYAETARDDALREIEAFRKGQPDYWSDAEKEARRIEAERQRGFEVDRDRAWDDYLAQCLRSPAGTRRNSPAAQKTVLPEEASPVWVTNAWKAMRREFDRQVEDGRELKRRALREAGWSASRKKHEAALAARREFLAARKEFQGVQKEYDEICKRKKKAQPDLDWYDDPDVEEIRTNRYAKARSRFRDAEIAYNEHFPEATTFRTETFRTPSAVSNALQRVKSFEDDLGKRYLPFHVKGDSLWFCGTSVNGVPLLESFKDELDWSFRADRNKATNILDHANAAAKYVRTRAIFGGFYFAGLGVEWENPKNPRDGISVLVDKGRFGPSTVRFVGDDGAVVMEDETTNSVPVASGSAYSAADVLRLMTPASARTNDLEGMAFNFTEFRSRFNALNADPDFRKADVVFSVSSDYDYGYDSPEASPTGRTTRAVRTELRVQENPNWWNRLNLPPPFAPIHGVVSVDNFNSMGETDRPLGEADTWMLRGTFQNQHRLLGRDAALTANGNVSLGGSLYGGAASWFLARPEDRGWADGGWRDWAFTAHGGYTKVDQGDVVPNLDILGVGYYGGLQGTTRLSDEFLGGSLDLSLGFTYRYVESSVRIEGQEIKLGPNGGDGYVIVPASAALMWSEKNLDNLFGFLRSDGGRLFLTLEAVYNLGGSSAEELAAFRPVIDDERYFLLRAQLARIEMLGSDSSSWWIPRVLFLRGELQWASTPVIGAEQFGLGGHATVRGYAERLFMGDTGASATIELRSPIDLLSWGDKRYAASNRLQLVLFADFGYFLLEEGTTNDQGAREDYSEFIASVGPGLRYSWKDLAFRFDWGVPLIRKDDKFDTSSSGAGHVSLQWQF